MPLVPVKLPEIAKPRVACQAILQANTSHAVRVQAFEFSVKRAKTYDAFMSDALAAGDAVCGTGKAFNGGKLATYLREKAHGKKSVKRLLAVPKSCLKAAT